MSTLEADFFAYLAQRAAVTALCGTRIHQGVMPPREVYPAIVYSVIGEDRPNGYAISGTANLQVESRLQVTCYAATSPAARALSNAVRNSVNGFKGDWNGRTIQAVFIDTGDDTADQFAESEAAKVFSVRYDLLVTHVDADDASQAGDDTFTECELRGLLGILAFG